MGPKVMIAVAIGIVIAQGRARRGGSGGKTCHSSLANYSPYTRTGPDSVTAEASHDSEAMSHPLPKEMLAHSYDYVKYFF